MGYGPYKTAIALCKVAVNNLYDMRTSLPFLPLFPRPIARHEIESLSLAGKSYFGTTPSKLPVCEMLPSGRLISSKDAS